MSSGEEFGGYSTHLFVNEDLIHKYICTICTLVARDPQQVSCCNTIYCKTCLLQLEERGSRFNCHNCHHSLVCDKYFRDRAPLLLMGHFYYLFFLADPYLPIVCELAVSSSDRQTKV